MEFSVVWIKWTLFSLVVLSIFKAPFAVALLSQCNPLGKATIKSKILVHTVRSFIGVVMIIFLSSRPIVVIGLLIVLQFISVVLVYVRVMVWVSIFMVWFFIDIIGEVVVSFIVIIRKAVSICFLALIRIVTPIFLRKAVFMVFLTLIRSVMPIVRWIWDVASIVLILMYFHRLHRI